MKVIDRFVLKSFIGPFLITFMVMVLFLLMQFVWKYIDDLVGRGVEWYYIAELLFYTAATVVPMALPLAVLLSSIMVLGGMGENNELAALKSAGLSLIRVMRPLIIFVVLITVLAFGFANLVIPIANFKSESLRRNITNKKPALSIRQGVFYGGIDGYSIKVGEKYGPDQNLLREVLIYDHSQRSGNTKVIVADSGKMEITADKRFLEFSLFHGNSYEEQSTNRVKERERRPFVRSSFEESLIRFSLDAFYSTDLRKERSKDFDMLNVRQLDEAVDSLKLSFEKLQGEFVQQMREKYEHREGEEPLLQDQSRSAQAQMISRRLEEKPSDSGSVRKVASREKIAYRDTVLLNFDPAYRPRILQNALRIARSNKAYYENAILQFEWRKKVITRHVLEWQKKFSVSFAIIVLFFIGAPLGAIIRKGGMGMPVVVSVMIFIVYHVTSFSFEKLGRYMVWEPIPAMWLANFILLPIGIWLTYKSATDSALFNLEVYLRPFEKLKAWWQKRGR